MYHFGGNNSQVINPNNINYGNDSRTSQLPASGPGQEIQTPYMYSNHEIHHRNASETQRDPLQSTATVESHTFMETTTANRGNSSTAALRQWRRRNTTNQMKQQSSPAQIQPQSSSPLHSSNQIQSTSHQNNAQVQFAVPASVTPQTIRHYANEIRETHSNPPKYYPPINSHAVSNTISTQPMEQTNAAYFNRNDPNHQYYGFKNPGQHTKDIKPPSKFTQVNYPAYSPQLGFNKSNVMTSSVPTITQQISYQNHVAKGSLYRSYDQNELRNRTFTTENSPTMPFALASTYDPYQRQKVPNMGNDYYHQMGYKYPPNVYKKPAFIPSYPANDEFYKYQIPEHSEIQLSSETANYGTPMQNTCYDSNWMQCCSDMNSHCSKPTQRLPYYPEPMIRPCNMGPYTEYLKDNPKPVNRHFEAGIPYQQRNMLRYDDYSNKNFNNNLNYNNNIVTPIKPQAMAPNKYPWDQNSHKNYQPLNVMPNNTTIADKYPFHGYGSAPLNVEHNASRMLAVANPNYYNSSAENFIPEKQSRMHPISDNFNSYPEHMYPNWRFTTDGNHSDIIDFENHIKVNELASRQKFEYSNKSKLNLKEFLETWDENEEVEDNGIINLPDVVLSNKVFPKGDNKMESDDKTLYVLESTNIPAETVWSDYKHVQQIDKLPDNIKLVEEIADEKTDTSRPKSKDSEANENEITLIENSVKELQELDVKAMIDQHVVTPDSTFTKPSNENRCDTVIKSPDTTADCPVTTIEDTLSLLETDGVVSSTCSVIKSPLHSNIVDMESDAEKKQVKVKVLKNEKHVDKISDIINSTVVTTTKIDKEPTIIDFETKDITNSEPLVYEHSSTYASRNSKICECSLKSFDKCEQCQTDELINELISPRISEICTQSNMSHYSSSKCDDASHDDNSFNSMSENEILDLRDENKRSIFGYCNNFENIMTKLNTEETKLGPSEVASSSNSNYLTKAENSVKTLTEICTEKYMSDQFLDNVKEDKENHENGLDKENDQHWNDLLNPTKIHSKDDEEESGDKKNRCENEILDLSEKKTGHNNDCNIEDIKEFPHIKRHLSADDRILDDQEIKSPKSPRIETISKFVLNTQTEMKTGGLESPTSKIELAQTDSNFNISQITQIEPKDIETPANKKTDDIDSSFPISLDQRAKTQSPELSKPSNNEIEINTFVSEPNSPEIDKTTPNSQEIELNLPSSDTQGISKWDMKADSIDTDFADQEQNFTVTKNDNLRENDKISESADNFLDQDFNKSQNSHELDTHSTENSNISILELDIGKNENDSFEDENKCEIDNIPNFENLAHSDKGENENSDKSETCNQDKFENDLLTNNDKKSIQETRIFNELEDESLSSDDHIDNFSSDTNSDIENCNESKDQANILKSIENIDPNISTNSNSLSSDQTSSSSSDESDIDSDAYSSTDRRHEELSQNQCVLDSENLEEKPAVENKEVLEQIDFETSGSIETLHKCSKEEALNSNEQNLDVLKQDRCGSENRGLDDKNLIDAENVLEQMDIEMNHEISNYVEKDLNISPFNENSFLNPIETENNLNFNTQHSDVSPDLNEPYTIKLNESRSSSVIASPVSNHEMLSENMVPEANQLATDNDDSTSTLGSNDTDNDVARNINKKWIELTEEVITQTCNLIGELSRNDKKPQISSDYENDSKSGFKNSFCEDNKTSVLNFEVEENHAIESLSMLCSRILKETPGVSSVDSSTEECQSPDIYGEVSYEEVVGEEIPSEDENDNILVENACNSDNTEVIEENNEEPLEEANGENIILILETEENGPTGDDVENFSNGVFGNNSTIIIAFDNDDYSEKVNKIDVEVPINGSEIRNGEEADVETEDNLMCIESEIPNQELEVENNVMTIDSEEQKDSEEIDPELAIEREIKLEIENILLGASDELYLENQNNLESKIRERELKLPTEDADPLSNDENEQIVVNYESEINETSVNSPKMDEFENENPNLWLYTEEEVVSKFHNEIKEDSIEAKIFDASNEDSTKIHLDSGVFSSDDIQDPSDSKSESLDEVSIELPNQSIQTIETSENSETSPFNVEKSPKNISEDAQNCSDLKTTLSIDEVSTIKYDDASFTQNNFESSRFYFEKSPANISVDQGSSDKQNNTLSFGETFVKCVKSDNEQSTENSENCGSEKSIINDETKMKKIIDSKRFKYKDFRGSCAEYERKRSKQEGRSSKYHHPYKRSYHDEKRRKKIKEEIESQLVTRIMEKNNNLEDFNANEQKSLPTTVPPSAVTSHSNLSDIFSNYDKYVERQKSVANYKIPKLKPYKRNNTKPKYDTDPGSESLVVSNKSKSSDNSGIKIKIKNLSEYRYSDKLHKVYKSESVYRCKSLEAGPSPPHNSEYQIVKQSNNKNALISSKLIIKDDNTVPKVIIKRESTNYGEQYSSSMSTNSILNNAFKWQPFVRLVRNTNIDRMAVKLYKQQKIILKINRVNNYHCSESKTHTYPSFKCRIKLDKHILPTIIQSSDLNKD